MIGLIQLIEIVPAAIVGMVLGALWYSPVLFGNAWMVAVGKNRASLSKPTRAMIGSAVACLLMAFGVSVLFQAIGVESLFTAISVGAVLGLLIIFPAMLSDNLFCEWGIALLVIQFGYRFLKIMAMSVVVYFI